MIFLSALPFVLRCYFVDASLTFNDVQINGKWLERSAGGNHSLPTWMDNPQYRLTLNPIPSRPHVLGELSVVCQTSRETCSNVRVIRAAGKRVDELIDSVPFLLQFADSPCFTASSIGSLSLVIRSTATGTHRALRRNYVVSLSFFIRLHSLILAALRQRMPSLSSYRTTPRKKKPTSRSSSNRHCRWKSLRYRKKVLECTVVQFEDRGMFLYRQSTLLALRNRRI